MLNARPRMQFELATAARIVFRPGAVADLPNIAREFGTRALLVTGRNTTRAAPLAANLKHAGIEILDLRRRDRADS